MTVILARQSAVECVSHISQSDIYTIFYMIDRQTVACNAYQVDLAIADCAHYSSCDDKGWLQTKFRRRLKTLMVRNRK
jgi:hypothetical protein